MHELSIALSIIDLASSEASNQGAARVGAVHLKIGALCGVVEDALRFSFELACEGTKLERSTLVIEQIQPAIFCSTCDAERTLNATQYLRCLVCGNVAPDLLRGKELELVALELIDEHATATC
jgi:hydrogenase nickel incorporation protein HypA/HybF